MPSVADFFTTISDAVTAFTSTFVSLLNGLTNAFWTPASSGTGGSFTFMGMLLLIIAGIGLVYFAYRVIRKLVARV